MGYGFRNADNLVALLMLRCLDTKPQLPRKQKNRNSESGLALRALYHTDYRSLVKYRFLIW